MLKLISFLDSSAAFVQAFDCLLMLFCGIYCLRTGAGLTAKIAEDCHGLFTGATGLQAENTSNCWGKSTNGIGLRADYAAMNCKGVSTNGNGLEADISATNCYGETSNAAAVGLKVVGTANTCGGKAPNGGGITIQAAIGIGCTTYGGTTSIPAANKFLGTP